MENHTPTPWIVSEDGATIKSKWITSFGTPIMVAELSGYIIGNRVQKANAEFIVRAVNAHEELVEALTLVFHQAENFEQKAFDMWLEDARAALAKAKGE